MLVRVAPGLFPPDLVVQIKALACELPAKFGLPLSRWSTDDLVRQVCQSGLVASISGSTLWRWLHQDAIRPWYHRSWIFPRDPNFAEKVGRLLDLYARGWESKPLKDDEFVMSADERPVFRRAAASTPVALAGRAPCTSSMNTFAAEPGPTLQHWTCITAESSAVARTAMVS